MPGVGRTVQEGKARQRQREAYIRTEILHVWLQMQVGGDAREASGFAIPAHIRVESSTIIVELLPLCCVAGFAGG